jgi:cyclopropane-fatty-acyl-phospholipid synthase
MNGSQRRLKAFRALLEDAHAALAPGFGFELWDGSTVPAGLGEGGMRLKFADEGVVAALLRRPRLDTLLQLHVAGRVDLIGGDLFALAAARPQG